MPTTPLGALNVPNTGDLPGAWGTTAVNFNMLAVDGSMRGVQSFSLSAATSFSLSAPSGSITPGAGPTQSQNAVLKFSGTLSGNAVVTLPLPGYYLVDNACNVGLLGTTYLQLRAVGTGQLLGAPPGETCHIYCDGTNVKFVNLGRVGEYLDLATNNFALTYPGWMSACSVKPYLLCDGTIFSTASYTALGTLLGGTFGGDGSSTFGVPDLQNRWRIPVGISTTRITSGSGGINGASVGASGGGATVGIGQTHLPNHNLSVTDPGHVHPGVPATTGFVGSVSAGGPPYYSNGSQSSGSAATGISVALNGGGTPLPLINPALVAGMTFIKT